MRATKRFYALGQRYHDLGFTFAWFMSWVKTIPSQRLQEQAKAGWADARWGAQMRRNL